MIDAHQMNYITVLYHNGFLVLQDICQIIILITTKNFVLFLSVAVVCTIIGNVCMSRKADALFPYLKETCHEKLPQEERWDILKNVKAMLMHKLGNVVVNNTDNLLISSFVGVVSAGIYSNYFLIIGSIRQVLDQALLGVSASVGNLGVLEDKDRVKSVFEQLFFIGYWLFGFSGICLFEMLNPFVEFAFGKKYLFPKEIVLVLCINFFINGTRRAVLIFKESMGLFWYDRYKAIAEALLNLSISILLVLHFGIVGIFIGTFCSTVLTSVWVEPYIIYKYRLKRPVSEFSKHMHTICLSWQECGRLQNVAAGSQADCRSSFWFTVSVSVCFWSICFCGRFTAERITGKEQKPCCIKYFRIYGRK